MTQQSVVYFEAGVEEGGVTFWLKDNDVFEEGATCVHTAIYSNRTDSVVDSSRLSSFFFNNIIVVFLCGLDLGGSGSFGLLDCILAFMFRSFVLALTLTLTLTLTRNP